MMAVRIELSYFDWSVGSNVSTSRGDNIANIAGRFELSANSDVLKRAMKLSRRVLN